MSTNRTRTKAKNKGFTLIEVVFTTGIAALLLGAISLNMGVQPLLRETATATPPQEALGERLDEIFIEHSKTELVALVGVDKNLNGLSDPVGTDNRRLVSVDNHTTGSGSNQTTLYVIEIASASGSLQRWFYP